MIMLAVLLLIVGLAGGALIGFVVGIVTCYCAMSPGLDDHGRFDSN